MHLFGHWSDRVNLFLWHLRHSRADGNDGKSTTYRKNKFALIGLMPGVQQNDRLCYNAPDFLETGLTTAMALPGCNFDEKDAPISGQ